MRDRLFQVGSAPGRELPFQVPFGAFPLGFACLRVLFDPVARPMVEILHPADPFLDGGVVEVILAEFVGIAQEVGPATLMRPRVAVIGPGEVTPKTVPA